MTYNAIELQRVAGDGSSMDESQLATDRSIDKFLVTCDGNAGEVLRVARKVLNVMLENASATTPESNDLERLLPGSFVANCGTHPTEEERKTWFALPLEERIEHEKHRRWSVKMFVNAFNPELGLRDWKWWNAKVIDEMHLLIEVEAPRDLYGWQSLKWLFLCSGATEIVPQE